MPHSVDECDVEEIDTGKDGSMHFSNVVPETTYSFIKDLFVPSFCNIAYYAFKQLVSEWFVQKFFGNTDDHVRKDGVKDQHLLWDDIDFEDVEVEDVESFFKETVSAVCKNEWNQLVNFIRKLQVSLLWQVATQNLSDGTQTTTAGILLVFIIFRFFLVGCAYQTLFLAEFVKYCLESLDDVDCVWLDLVTQLSDKTLKIVNDLLTVDNVD